MMVLIIYPLQQRDPQSVVADVVMRRFRPIANFSLLVLLMTGVVQTGGDEHYEGVLNFNQSWSQAMLGKHLAFFGMVAVVGFLQFGLSPALERARLIAAKGDDASFVQLQNRERRLTQANFALSIIVLIFTAMATAI